METIKSAVLALAAKAVASTSGDEAYGYAQAANQLANCTWVFTPTPAHILDPARQVIEVGVTETDKI